jgi:molybdate transport system substrate-binding protein
LTIAVAANFILPSKALILAFERQTGVTIKATYTSSGNLYGQIIRGAPYDLFLSADEARPSHLFNEGLAEEPFVYARGKLVLWGLGKEFWEAARWQDALLMPKVKRVAIANPETAPYGTASEAVLKGTGLWTLVKPRLVFAQTIAQAFQYAHIGAVDLSFCAYSSVFSEQGKRGFTFMVNEAPDVVQWACILKRTRDRKAAEAFAAFIASPEVKALKAKYGYD